MKRASFFVCKWISAFYRSIWLIYRSKRQSYRSNRMIYRSISHKYRSNGKSLLSLRILKKNLIIPVYDEAK